jgi:type I restriction enzyme S subunit
MSSEWPTAKLGDLTINLDTKRKPVKEADRRPGPYPYYGASGIVDHVDGYIFDGEHLLIAEDGENLRTRQTPIAFRATGKFWVNNHAHIVVGNERASTRYLEYAVLASDITSYLTGAVMPKLTQGNMNRIEVPCPSRDVQDQIVGILGSLDDRITLLRETNTTLEAIAQALFKSWFVDFDPVHAKMRGEAPEGMDEATATLFPDSFEDSEHGPAPKGWEFSTLGKSFELTMGQSPPGDTYNQTENGLPFYQGRTDFGFRFPTKRIYCNAPTRLAEIGDALVSVRAPVGDVNMAIERCCIGRGVAAVRHQSGCVGYTFYAMKNLGSHFENFDSEGTIFGSINKKDFEALPVVAPNEGVLFAFDEISKALDGSIEINEQKIRVLVEIRDTLLPRLITGHIQMQEIKQTLQEAEV